MSWTLVVVLVVVYGGMIGAGGVLWLLGRMSRHGHLAKIGRAGVFAGLCLDVVLLVCNWLFDWVAWLQARVQ